MTFSKYFIRVNTSGKILLFRIDDYVKDGGGKLFTKMHCVLIANP